MEKEEVEGEEEQFSGNLTSVKDYDNNVLEDRIYEGRIVNDCSISRIQTLEGHSGSVDKLLFFPTHSRIVSCSDSTLKIWSFPNNGINKRYEVTTIDELHREKINDIIMWNEKSGIILTCSSGIIKSFSIITMKELEIFSFNLQSVILRLLHLKKKSNGCFLTLDDVGEALIVSYKEKRIVKTLHPMSGAGKLLGFGIDKRYTSLLLSKKFPNCFYINLQNTSGKRNEKSCVFLIDYENDEIINNQFMITGRGLFMSLSSAYIPTSGQEGEEILFAGESNQALSLFHTSSSYLDEYASNLFGMETRLHMMEKREGIGGSSVVFILPLNDKNEFLVFLDNYSELSVLYMQINNLVDMSALPDIPTQASLPNHLFTPGSGNILRFLRSLKIYENKEEGYGKQVCNIQVMNLCRNKKNVCLAVGMSDRTVKVIEFSYFTNPIKDDFIASLKSFASLNVLPLLNDCFDTFLAPSEKSMKNIQTGMSELKKLCDAVGQDIKHEIEKLRLSFSERLQPKTKVEMDCYKLTVHAEERIGFEWNTWEQDNAVSLVDSQGQGRASTELAMAYCKKKKVMTKKKSYDLEEDFKFLNRVVFVGQTKLGEADEVGRPDGMGMLFTVKKRALKKDVLVPSYFGRFKNGVFHGMCCKDDQKNRQFDANGKLEYEGEFSHGLRQGKGKLFDAKTQRVVFEGEFRAGLPHGMGKEFALTKAQTNVVSFSGRFSQGKREGPGDEYDVANTGSLVHGNWSEGVLLKDGASSIFTCPLVCYKDIEKHLKNASIISSCRDEITYKIRAPAMQGLLKGVNGVLKKHPFVAIKVRKCHNEEFTRQLFSDTVKGVSKRHVLGTKYMEQHENENMKTHFILQTFGIIRGEREVGEIIECCEQSVEEYYLKKEDWKDSEIVRVLYETAKALVFLKAQGADYTPNWRNVFLSPDGSIKLSFDRISSSIVVPPEVHLGESWNRDFSNIFTFGLMIYSLLWKIPMVGIFNQKTCSCGRDVKDIKMRNLLDKHVAVCNLRPVVSRRDYFLRPKYLMDLMFLCWDKIPVKRPTIEQIFSILDSSGVSVVYDAEDEEIKEKKRNQSKGYSIIRLHYFFGGKKGKNMEGEDKMLLVDPKLKNIVLWIERRMQRKEKEKKKIVAIIDAVTKDVLRTDVDVSRFIERKDRLILHVNFRKERKHSSQDDDGEEEVENSVVISSSEERGREDIKMKLREIQSLKRENENLRSIVVKKDLEIDGKSREISRLSSVLSKKEKDEKDGVRMMFNLDGL